ncbi:MAG: hypothetical protein WAZ18_05000 [Alphaproteobacteria bacterium]
MKRNETDKRPITLHISKGLFWSSIVLAVALPIVGFGLSAGVVAPAWLKLDFSSMQHKVELAEKIQKEGEVAKAEMADVKTKLDEERKLRAEAETKVTMSETAREEATTKLTEMEQELLALKQSVATYEQLLKPKLSRELLQCVNLTASMDGNVVNYSLSFAKVGQTAKLPAGLVARVRVVAGDNAVAMSTATSGDKVVNHTLDTTKDLALKGSLSVTLPPDTTRLIDVKVFEKDKPVGYCWKAF